MDPVTGVPISDDSTLTLEVDYGVIRLIHCKAIFFPLKGKSRFSLFLLARCIGFGWFGIASIHNTTTGTDERRQQNDVKLPFPHEVDEGDIILDEYIQEE